MANSHPITGKKLYSIPELYGIAHKSFRSGGDFSHGLKSGLLSEQLKERIMRAVTAVNDCPMCSYAHTEMALKSGLSPEEVKLFVSGDFPDIPDREVKAVLFAQHYADRRGKPSRSAWEELVHTYGEEQARCILAACRIIMMGNSGGIVLSSVGNRLHHQPPDPRSSIGYELSVLLCLFPILLISLVHALLGRLFHTPVIRPAD